MPYTEYDYQNELMHYGVPGMKWGVRKGPDSYGTLGRRKAKRLVRMMNREERRLAQAKSDYNKTNPNTKAGGIIRDYSQTQMTRHSKNAAAIRKHLSSNGVQLKSKDKKYASEMVRFAAGGLGQVAYDAARDYVDNNSVWKLKQNQKK